MKQVPETENLASNRQNTSIWEEGEPVCLHQQQNKITPSFLIYVPELVTLGCSRVTEQKETSILPTATYGSLGMSTVRSLNQGSSRLSSGCKPLTSKTGRPPKHEHLAYKGCAAVVPTQVPPEPFMQATKERLLCGWKRPTSHSQATRSKGHRSKACASLKKIREKQAPFYSDPINQEGVNGKNLCPCNLRSYHFWFTL